MTKKAIRILLVLTLGLLMACIGVACSGTDTDKQDDGVPEVTTQGSTEGLENLAIIHTNDTHGYDQATDGCLGMAAVAQLKADYKAKGYEVLLLDAGDVVQGNSLVEDSKGEDDASAPNRASSRYPRKGEPYGI